MTNEDRDNIAERAEAMSAAFVESRAPMIRLDGLPLRHRDEVVAQVWRFLTERGYTITAPAMAASPGCLCGHEKYAHASTQPTWCLVKGGCDCSEFEVSNA